MNTSALDAPSLKRPRLQPAKVLSLLLLVATVALLGGAAFLGGAPPGELAITTWMVVTAALGTVIVWRAGSRIGWVLQIALAVAAIGGLAEDHAAAAVRAGRIDTGAIAAAWIAHWSRIPAIGAFVFLFLLFPTGRLPGPRWRPVAALATVALALITAAVALTPGPMEGQPAITNPLGIAGASPLLERVESAGSWLLLAAAVAAFASLVLRVRRTSGDEREQVKWLLYAAALLVVTGAFAMITEGPLNELSFVALLAGLFALPLALTVALTKYRLYEIDVVINRTIVYAALTAVVVVLYILIVGIMGALLQQRVGLIPALIATGIVAVVFQPLRRISQDAVDRITYGERRNPYGALTGLASRLESTFGPDQVLPAIVETVAGSLKLDYVAIGTEHDGSFDVAASTGERGSRDVETLPIVYQGTEVGRLLVLPRKGDTLSATDIGLLADLARNAGPAVHSVALTEALRRSRNELLATREEERRRLRRDLHDGLGPELAGIALGVGAARNLSVRDPAEARAVLARVQEQAEGATRSIRGLVEGLRPPALDELGVVDAIRQKVSAMLAGSDIELHMAAPDDTTPLPAAVEIAALRITLEAVTNVLRHSQARRCDVTVSRNGALVIAVSDDGAGIDARRSGVGLVSMRERAEEVGGSLTIEPRPEGGTLVRATLPLP